MNKTGMTNLAEEKSEPLGDTGDGNTGAPEGEQGISNRAGDKADDATVDEFEADFDELGDEEEEEHGAM